METGISTSITGINAFSRHMEMMANNIANGNPKGYNAKVGKFNDFMN
jgi:flagellar basal body rod protein FlgG